MRTRSHTSREDQHDEGLDSSYDPSEASSTDSTFDSGVGSEVSSVDSDSESENITTIDVSPSGSPVLVESPNDPIIRAVSQAVRGICSRHNISEEGFTNILATVDDESVNQFRGRLTAYIRDQFEGFWVDEVVVDEVVNAYFNKPLMYDRKSELFNPSSFTNAALQTGITTASVFVNQGFAQSAMYSTFSFISGASSLVTNAVAGVSRSFAPSVSETRALTPEVEELALEFRTLQDKSIYSNLDIASTVNIVSGLVSGVIEDNEENRVAVVNACLKLTDSPLQAIIDLINIIGHENTSDFLRNLSSTLDNRLISLATSAAVSGQVAYTGDLALEKLRSILNSEECKELIESISDEHGRGETFVQALAAVQTNSYENLLNTTCGLIGYGDVLQKISNLIRAKGSEIEALTGGLKGDNGGHLLYTEDRKTSLENVAHILSVASSIGAGITEDTKDSFAEIGYIIDRLNQGDELSIHPKILLINAINSLSEEEIPSSLLAAILYSIDVNIPLVSGTEIKSSKLMEMLILSDTHAESRLTEDQLKTAIEGLRRDERIHTVTDLALSITSIYNSTRTSFDKAEQIIRRLRGIDDANIDGAANLLERLMRNILPQGSSDHATRALRHISGSIRYVHNNPQVAIAVVKIARILSSPDSANLPSLERYRRMRDAVHGQLEIIADRSWEDNPLEYTVNEGIEFLKGLMTLSDEQANQIKELATRHLLATDNRIEVVLANIDEFNRYDSGQPAASLFNDSSTQAGLKCSVACVLIGAIAGIIGFIPGVIASIAVGILALGMVLFRFVKLSKIPVHQAVIKEFLAAQDGDNPNAQFFKYLSLASAIALDKVPDGSSDDLRRAFNAYKAIDKEVLSSVVIGITTDRNQSGVSSETLENVIQGNIVPGPITNAVNSMKNMFGFKTDDDDHTDLHPR